MSERNYGNITFLSLLVFVETYSGQTGAIPVGRPVANEECGGIMRNDWDKMAFGSY